MVLLPAFNETVSDELAQVSQSAVTGKFTVLTVAPFRLTVAGRTAPVPLENRNVTVAVPADAALTVHAIVAPVTLSVLQNPVPEKFRWLLSMVPWQVPDSA